MLTSKPFEVLRCLLQAGANPDSDLYKSSSDAIKTPAAVSKKKTLYRALDVAVGAEGIRSNLGLVRLLLDHGADTRKLLPSSWDHVKNAYEREIYHLLMQHQQAKNQESSF